MADKRQGMSLNPLTGIRSFLPGDMVLTAGDFVVSLNPLTGIRSFLPFGEQKFLPSKIYTWMSQSPHGDSFFSAFRTAVLESGKGG